MARLPLLLLLVAVVGFVFAAPIDQSDPEVAAKLFWGALSENISENIGEGNEVTGLVYDKLEELYPGLITKEEALKIRNSLISHKEQGTLGTFTFPQEITDRISNTLKDRLVSLSDAAKNFLEDRSDHLSVCWRSHR
ncbi:hypothetical protein PENTCL1PPCAC_1312 [Pristionchus entomophagus]|uniref:Uncharacterized protein n=1 Tax=Pristionchus entomophagus TaxID=358040 RepID=A0AAV5S837_9BILA|nr:hypothetical protein PENTCL1PPCAC_1312 [Pristionchus entomophagus]